MVDKLGMGMIRFLRILVLILFSAGAARADDFVVDGAAETDTVMLHPVLTARPVESFTFTGTIHCKGDGEGLAIVFLDAAYHKDDSLPAHERYEEPNIVRSIAIGFDTSNPATTDPFNADGNIEDRL
ncbi:MAG TPA: hypothetical protein PK402_08435, partial [Tepidisphaeraceae bacterium]|nr:hypothetical protein [Tepidisphaeraceae bacterium]